MQKVMEIMEGKGVQTRSGFTSIASRADEFRTGSRSAVVTGREFIDDIGNVQKARWTCSEDLEQLLPFYQRIKY